MRAVDENDCLDEIGQGAARNELWQGLRRCQQG